ncbi:replicative DNA helicase [Paracoccus aerodenitrificans]|uniref:replicative DNA helicase n=1 Tax=Paracoccus aerodenitrificans TaxID=3017781 RepID=UPI0022F080A6|nr:replicative DNA helicase [Paracoccus aerodenitrificans]WBU63363.1 replicative DNA helicase [Paracoccus aerodenitrificans]
MSEIRALQQVAPAADSDEQSVPFSIEAEQQLLGALLTNNDVFDRVSQLLKPEHFYEPVHSRIFQIASERIRKNALASPVTLKAFMEDDAGLKDLGGPAYLARIAAAAISAYAARDYAQMIREFALRRDLITLGQDISARAASVRVEDDAEEQIKAAEQTLYKLGEQGVAERGFQSFLKAVTGAVDAAAAAYERDGQLSGIPTGLLDLDRKMGGLNNSDLIILAGRPSMGKTSLATNIAFNIAKAHKTGQLPDGTQGSVAGGVVGFFSLEMSAEQLAARILSEASEVPSHQIRSGDMTEEEFRRFVQAANDLQSCPLYIDDTPALPINQLAGRARKLKRTHGLDLLIVDYLQLLKAASAKDSRVNEVSEITQGLKAVAKELNIPVIALSQLSRQVESREDKRPQLSDLRESGSIEQDADIVMFVFREEYYKEREKPADHELEKLAKWQEVMNAVHGKAEVIIGKQRHGPIGTVELAFEGRFTRFGNLEKTRQSEWD